MGVSRRTFLAALGLGGVVAAVASLWRSGGDQTGGDDVLERAFETHYEYLRLDRDGLRRFLRDYQDAYGSLLDDAGRPVETLPYLKFLESSDFFVNGADERRVVRYLLLRDPYLNPCFNPFPDA